MLKNNAILKHSLNIVYLHQYFQTPDEGGAVRSWHIARALAAAGHTVNIISAGNTNDKRIVSNDGFTVHYLPVKYDNAYSPAQRIAAFLRFMRASFKLSAQLKPDIIYASSTPLTVGISALWMKWLYNVPYIFEVRDLWPEAPVQLGFLKNPILINLSRWAEKLIYKNAAHVIALSGGMKEGILKVWPGAKASTVPNFADIEYFNKPENTDHKPELPGRFIGRKIISYTGSIGFSNRVSSLIDFAAWCHSIGDESFAFVIAGKGAEAEKLKAAAANLHNVVFLGHLNRHQTAGLLSVSSFSYVCFGLWPVLQTNSPNKLFDALAAGVPIIVNQPGWMQELAENGCGIFAEEGRFAELYLQASVYADQNKDTLKEHILNTAWEFRPQKGTAVIVGIVNSLAAGF
ncbi:MAG: glycosyltransferase family 4 protein [Bacteroidota bacterium]